jgi:uncharacterized protein (TIGR03435 family)
MERLIGALTCVLAFAACEAAGQQATDEHLTFEAASVKLSNGAPVGPPNSDGGPGTRYPEWFGTDTTLRWLLFRAYGLSSAEEQVSGPGWIDSQKYAIEARVPRGTTKEQFRQMLQNLLAERFKLTVHHETVQLSVYELAMAKGGPKLKGSETVAAEATPPPTGRFGADSDRDGFPVLPGPGLVSRFGPGMICHLTAKDQSISSLARTLSGPNAAGRIVVDKTGLAGKYDFTLYYEFQAPGASAAVESSNLAPILFDAVQQQLGLKLVNAKAPFDRVVIDRAEKIPIEN